MRKPDWEHRLHDYIASASATPYIYGRHDCLLHCADAVRAMTGKDHARGHRGKYNSALGAAKYLKRIGHDTPEALLDSLFDEKPVGFAQRGDIVLTPDGIPGVCYGEDALIVGENGLIRIPRALWSKAWSV